MKNIILLFITACLFSLTGLTQIASEKILIENINSKLEVKVPAGYLIKEKPGAASFFNSHSPLWGISYDGGKVVFTCTQTLRRVDDNGIPGFTDELISIVKEKARAAKLVDDGILLQEGKNIGFIKFLSKDNAQKKYNYLFYLSVDEQLVLFSFDCLNKARKKWEAIAEQVAASIRVIR